MGLIQKKKSSIVILYAFFRDKISLQGCFLISYRNFSSIKMNRFSRFHIKSGANIEKNRKIWYNFLNDKKKRCWRE